MAEEVGRYCARCGYPEGAGGVAFRSPAAVKCVECDDVAEAERRRYFRIYHRARNKSVKRLIAKHQVEFERMLVTERKRAEVHEEEREAAIAAGARKKRRTAA